MIRTIFDGSLQVWDDSQNVVHQVGTLFVFQNAAGGGIRRIDVGQIRQIYSCKYIQCHFLATKYTEKWQMKVYHFPFLRLIIDFNFVCSIKYSHNLFISFFLSEIICSRSILVRLQLGGGQTGFFWPVYRALISYGVNIWISEEHYVQKVSALGRNIRSFWRNIWHHITDSVWILMIRVYDRMFLRI